MKKTVARSRVAGTSGVMRLAGLLLAGPLLCLSLEAGAAGGAGAHLESMKPDLRDRASLQRGLKTYINYCMGCHALGYQRYERTADDLEIPHEIALDKLIFDSEQRIGSLMTNNMRGELARNWFGAPPPDLTMINRVKGTPDWLYTYLKTFYLDDSRPLGVNNLVFPNTGMPHALLELQGVQRKTCKQIPRIAENGGEMRHPLTGEPITEEVCDVDELHARGHTPLEPVAGTGLLSPEEYDRVVYDLVNFLWYTAEPVRLERQTVGYYVLFFLAFFFVFAYLLDREYWRDVHHREDG